MAIERLGCEEIDPSLIFRSRSEARQQKVDVDVGELAASIRSQGLLEPIHLVEIEGGKSYELIDGQRRYLAFLMLGKDSPQRFSRIPSFVYKNTMEDWEKKTMSLHANLSRAPLTDSDKINATTVVYNHFNSIRKTAEATGFSESAIRRHVHAARLPEELRDRVEEGHISVSTALETADLYGYDPGDPKKADMAGMLSVAEAMQKLAVRQKRHVREIRQEHPDRDMHDIISDVKSKRRTKYDITVTVESDTMERIDAYRERNRTRTTLTAAADLIQDGLASNEM